MKYNALAGAQRSASSQPGRGSPKAFAAMSPLLDGQQLGELVAVDLEQGDRRPNAEHILACVEPDVGVVHRARRQV
jgi:hypothetical protein